MIHPLDEKAVRFIMDSTWTEATRTLAKLAREAADKIDPSIDARTALHAFANMIDMMNHKSNHKGGSA